MVEAIEEALQATTGETSPTEGTETSTNAETHLEAGEEQTPETETCLNHPEEEVMATQDDNEAEANVKAETSLKEEEEAIAKVEDDARLADEEAAKAKDEEDARVQAEAEEAAKLKAEEDARLQAEAEAQAKAEEDARIATEEAAKVKAEEDARQKAEEETKAAEVAQLAAEEAAKAKDEEGARLQAEAEEAAKLKAEEDSRLQAEAEEKAKAEEESRLKAEEDARIAVEEAAKAKAEEDVRQKAEEEAKAAEVARLAAEEADMAKAKEDAKLKAEEDARLQAEAEAQAKAEEETRLQTEEAAQKAMAEEESLLKAKEDARIAAEEAAKVKAEEEARQKAEEEANNAEVARLAAEDAATAKAEEDARLQIEAEEAAKLKTEEDSRLQAEAEEKKIAEEVEAAAKAKTEEESSLKAEEDARIAAEEEAKVKAEEDARQKVEEEAKKAEVALIEAKNEEDARQKVEEETKAMEAASAEEAAIREIRMKREYAEATKAEDDAQKSEIQQDEGHSSQGASFAGAFGGKSPKDGLITPKATVSTTLTTPATAPMTGETDPTSESSHSAASAAKNKRVSGRVSAYMEKIAVNPLPGDSIRSPTTSARKSLNEESQARRLSFFPLESPLYVKAVKSDRLSMPNIDTKVQRPVDVKAHIANYVADDEVDKEKIKSIREKFQKSASTTGVQTELVFGEAFREKKRFETLTDKHKTMEARSSIRGFDLMSLEVGKSTMGEVDTSNIQKTFVFDGTAEEHVQLHDGTPLVDYKNKDYQGYVFLVHRTRGLMLLRCTDSPRFAIPGGKVQEDEFLRAAKLSGNDKVQLQIAAREGAARQLYEATGIDVRAHLERLKPAVLQMHPVADATGHKLLKNEHENSLFYFLQVAEEDFQPTQATADQDDSALAPPLDEADSSMKLKLSKGYETFTFAKEPVEAAEMLKEHSDGKSTHALNMVMNQASQAPPAAPVPPPTAETMAELKKNPKSGQVETAPAPDAETEGRYAVKPFAPSNLPTGGKEETSNGKKEDPPETGTPGTVSKQVSAINNAISRNSAREETPRTEPVTTSTINKASNEELKKKSYPETTSLAAEAFAKDAELNPSRGVGSRTEPKSSQEEGTEEGVLCCCSFW